MFGRTNKNIHRYLQRANTRSQNAYQRSLRVQSRGNAHNVEASRLLNEAKKNLVKAAGLIQNAPKVSYTGTHFKNRRNALEGLKQQKLAFTTKKKLHAQIQKTFNEIRRSQALLALQNSQERMAGAHFNYQLQRHG
ncbi:hypothetical protein EBT25_08475 [bacterium]|jgi:hypothetical protein|nr:hypothetical protein [bacterium]